MNYVLFINKKMEIINTNSFYIANEIRKMISKGWDENELLIENSNFLLFHRYGPEYLISIMNYTELIEKINDGFIIKYQNYFIEINYKYIDETKFIIYFKLIEN
jgi:hypothetical protein